MPDLLVVFGITGQQGSSVVNTVLEHPQLKNKYKIRGITRDPSKAEAKAFRDRGVEVVAGDTNDRASMTKALQGAGTVFAMTTSIYAPGGFEEETAQGKAIADEAVAAGVRLLVYSTVPSAKKISNGKYPVGSFDCKDEVAEYIKTLPIKSAMFAPASFMSNFTTFMAPRPGQDGTLTITNFCDSRTEWPLIDIAGDTGKYVGAILADPEKYAGATFCAATGMYSFGEIAETMTKVIGKPVKHQQVPKDVYASFLPDATRDTFLNMMSYIEEDGYYGPDSAKLVEWAAKNALTPPTTFEDFLRRTNPQL